MINCNPETVSTDYDTSDRLYFEPLTLEDVLEVIHAESQSRRAGRRDRAARRPDRARARQGPRGGRRADPRHLAGGDRPGRGARAVLEDPRRGEAARAQERNGDRRAVARCAVAEEIGYPVLVRPSYVLGGRGMEIVYDTPESLERLLRPGRASRASSAPARRCWSTASWTTRIEIDVDALYDGNELYIGGIMEHIEEAGIHSGDSACTLPPVTLGRDVIDRVREATPQDRRGHRRPRPAQRAVRDRRRACSTCSRRIRARRAPCRSSRRRSGIPLAKAASLIMVGRSIRDLVASGMLPVARRLASCRWTRRSPSRRPCCRSSASAPRRATSSTRCSAPRCARPARSWASTPTSRARSPRARMPRTAACPAAARSSSRSPTATSAPSSCRCCGCQQLGFDILATEGTAEVLARNGIPATIVRKYFMGQTVVAGEPSIVDLINAGKIDIVINTPSGRSARADGYEIRTATVAADKPLFTTIAQLGAAVASFEVPRGACGCAACRTTRSIGRRRLAARLARAGSPSNPSNPPESPDDRGFRGAARARLRRPRPALRRHRPARRAAATPGGCRTRPRRCASSACGSSMPSRAGPGSSSRRSRSSSATAPRATRRSRTCWRPRGPPACSSSPTSSAATSAPASTPTARPG